ncbi:MAG: hypothetical protein R3246_12290, partial [Acidimicrobiia bacterium]|nr:hypothetical protein [Acidimicrobiia bacterium]
MSNSGEFRRAASVVYEDKDPLATDAPIADDAPAVIFHRSGFRGGFLDGSESATPLFTGPRWLAEDFVSAWLRDAYLAESRYLPVGVGIGGLVLVILPVISIVRDPSTEALQRARLVVWHVAGNVLAVLTLIVVVGFVIAAAMGALAPLP